MNGIESEKQQYDYLQATQATDSMGNSNENCDFTGNTDTQKKISYRRDSEIMQRPSGSQTWHLKIPYLYWLVVWNIFYFPIYWE